MKHKFFKILRFSFFAVVVFVTLAALFLVGVKFQGKRAWDAYKREALARGEKMDLSAFNLPPVPDDQNFAMTPLLKSLFGPDIYDQKRLEESLKLQGARPDSKSASFGKIWKMERTDLGKWRAYFGTPDILGTLKKYDPQLEEIRAASLRPFCRFPVRYEDGYTARLPHLVPLMNLGRIYALRTLAFLDQGQVDQAFADEETLARLVRSVQDEPPLISLLVQISLNSMNMQILWEGLSAHQWSESQLITMEDRLRRVDFLKDIQRALQYEKVGAADAFLRMAHDSKLFQDMVAMSGNVESEKSRVSNGYWALKMSLYQNQNILACSQFFDRYYLPVLEPSLHRVHTEIAAEGERTLANTVVANSVTTQLLKLAGPALLGSISKVAYAQTLVDEARIACALERYRLAHGEYPEKLDVLVPQYLATLPHDIVNGEPLHYRRTPDGLFLLYSVGWNGRDDGGVSSAKKESAAQDIQQGDWVWRYPSAQ